MRRLPWHAILHLIAYVLQGVAGLVFLFFLALWILRGLNVPIPQFVPDAALEPLTVLIETVVLVALGRMAEWASKRAETAITVQNGPTASKPQASSPALSLPPVPPSQQGGIMTNSPSCFISYSHKDEAFAQKLHDRLRQANINVWYAPEDMKAGQKLYDQVKGAIQAQDKLLLILSNESMSSEWVMTEIRRARQAEITTKQRKLFPVRLVDFSAIRQWECFDADTGKDLAVEVREYFIPDFSDWQDDAAFNTAAERVIKDLQA